MVFIIKVKSDASLRIGELAVLLQIEILVDATAVVDKNVGDPQLLFLQQVPHAYAYSHVVSCLSHVENLPPIVGLGQFNLIDEIVVRTLQDAEFSAVPDNVVVLVEI